MDKLKVVIRNKVVIRALIMITLTTASVTTLSDDQLDGLADAIVMILSLLG